jgi:hypothetical protein
LLSARAEFKLVSVPMEKKAHVSFKVQPFEGTLSITPVVDGTPLPEIVAAFERDEHFEPAGGYGGLIPEWFKYGALDKYFLGDFEKDSYFARMNRVYLLGCQCGEVGCWPLLARIRAEGESVVWDSFEQPHRKDRDYSGFGPFIFDAEQYREAVAALPSTNR